MALETVCTNTYTAFGLEISSDLSLPELPVNLKPEIVVDQVSITASAREDWPELNASVHSTPTVQMASNDWRLELEGIGWFRVHQGTCINWQRWDDSVSDRDLRTFLVSSALGALMIQRGSLMLQATALVRDGKAVLLLGPPASGKSTLAWCLHQQGWQLLSSELTLVDPQGMAWPGMQQIKVWHDAAMELDLDLTVMPVVRKGLRRYSFMPTDLSTANQPTPLAAIYGITRRDKAKNKDKEEEELRIVAWAVLRQQAALLQLRNQAFQPRFYRGMEQEQQLFLHVAALVRSIGLYHLVLPDDVKRMQIALKDANLLDPISLAPELSEPASESLSEAKSKEEK
ncbi:hypothetical protein PMIT1313_01099 [Prochlorococcus marinus str. MIT 1313]|uniref:hypothetical protein n=1 Tax=Prochlorococcus TaxID=1218 RepID=UPI0007B3A372|nr:hypothetical protein [Prochlorococcus marinus]KZR69413.1 hypothetical protein PMIT1313_01099 [Prochlorococcus marinus str. MIT 1313]KZR72641.1 hypothetical protein PMIT1318_01157 [Prochlorococcus marinus str. MIT 1318]